MSQVCGCIGVAIVCFYLGYALGAMSRNKTMNRNKE